MKIFKLNNKGIAISGVLYSILVLFLALLFGILTLLASSKHTFDKQKNDIINKLNGNEEIDTIINELPLYEDGITVYFNPETGTKCDNYTVANSNNGVKTGCMKWYTFGDSEDSSTINLILDHSTSAAKWSSDTNATYEIPVMLDGLSNDTSLWTGVPVRTDSYTGKGNYGSYIINYSGLRAKLISAEEVAEIADFKNFSSTTKNEYYFAKMSTLEVGDAKTTTGWLYDRMTGNCTDVGCYNNANNYSIYGYWTSTQDYGIYYDEQYAYAGMFSMDSKILGVRPVITISKTKLR